MKYLEAEDRADVFVLHDFDEHVVDLGEVRLNYSTVGDPALPPLVLVPGQCNSWWAYEKAMPLLTEAFQVFAVDLRGQGRSTWTPAATRSTTSATISCASSTSWSAGPRS